eukprot:1341159-Amphidinium_carterae.1
MATLGNVQSFRCKVPWWKRTMDVCTYYDVPEATPPAWPGACLFSKTFPMLSPVWMICRPIRIGCAWSLPGYLKSCESTPEWVSHVEGNPLAIVLRSCRHSTVEEGPLVLWVGAL